MNLRYLAGFLLCVIGGAAHAVPAPFDLAGPTLEVKVTRGATTLPIAEVPNLAAGDRIWIKADLPPSQSAHYLLIAAFLNGATNPPPSDWFFRCQTWTEKCGHDGMTVTVPKEAQQVLVFFAPETGGDFRTLVSAVRGRPGAFVRTSQDLNQAALDRSRLEIYLKTIRELNDSDPTKLKDLAPLLARSLAIRVDEKCLDRAPALQAPCLMQGQETLILNDGHSTSIVEALTSGPASDLAMEASYTPQLSYGIYSPYVAAVLDIGRLLDPFRTAQYQYIPALATPSGDRLALILNAAPSFYNPKSVLVVALPAVEKPQLPPLHALDPKELYCARKTSLVLPVEGAPLVFSTSYAHDVTLRLTGADGALIDLAVKRAPAQGGLVVDTTALGHASLGDVVQGQLRGYWGFDTYEGPTFSLVNSRTQPWGLVPGNSNPLIVGRETTVHLQAENVSCVDSIMLKDPAGKQLKVDWKPVKPNEVELKLPLEGAAPGAVTLMVSQYGAHEPQPVQLQAFSEASRLDGFSIHAGDTEGVLKGSRLDEVAALTIGGMRFVPGNLSSDNGSDVLTMSLADPSAVAALKADTVLAAHVTLNDGRVIGVSASVDAPRPSVKLLHKSVQEPELSADNNIQLGSDNELPQDAQLIFSVRAQSPRRFVRDEAIEVETDDDEFKTTLSVANGGLTLEDARVAVATLDPIRAFGPSAFGPLQFRVTANGVAGEWQPLAMLVRLPFLKQIDCPATPELACKLSGGNLFLIDSFAADASFSHPVRVPDGFPGSSLPVPHMTAGQLYMRLRDDPTVLSMAKLTPQSLSPSPDELARADARHAAAPPVDRDNAVAAAATPPSPPSPPSPATPPNALSASPAPPPSAVAPSSAPLSNANAASASPLPNATPPSPPAPSPNANATPPSAAPLPNASAAPLPNASATPSSPAPLPNANATSP
jgi:hypothetical protein